MHRAQRLINAYPLIQVILQLAAAAGMAQLTQSFGLDLTNTFACNMELFADFFQRAATAVVQAEAQLEYLALALSQAFKHIFHLLFQQLVAGSISRSKCRVIFNEVTQVAIIFFAYRRLQTHRLLADLDNLAHFLRTDLHLLGNLLGRGFTSQVLQQTTTDTNQAIDRLHHMHGDTNCSSLVGNRTRNRLANPPGGVRAKLVAFRVIEFLDRTNQAYIALLDQIQQAHATTNILFRHADNQAQVSLSQAALCLFPIFNKKIITVCGWLE